MGYTMVDLIDKLIIIEKRACEIYSCIAKADTRELSIKSTAKILLKEEERHIRYYKELEKRLMNEPGTEIDFFVYDKISSLIDLFKNRIIAPDLFSTQELLKFALNLEQENKALLIDIRGRLVMTKGDVSSQVYKLLEQIIKEEEKHIRNLKMFIKQ